MRGLPAKEIGHVEDDEEVERRVHLDVAGIIDKERIDGREQRDQERAAAIGELPGQIVHGGNGQGAEEGGEGAGGGGRECSRARAGNTFGEIAPPAKGGIPGGQKALAGDDGGKGAEHRGEGIVNPADGPGFIGPIGLVTDAPVAQKRGEGGEEKQQGEKRWGGAGLRG